MPVNGQADHGEEIQSGRRDSKAKTIESAARAEKYRPRVRLNKRSQANVTELKSSVNADLKESNALK